MRFPTKFTNGIRQVEITGEAYFEVSSNKEIPFVVDVNQRSVNDWGSVLPVLLVVKPTLLMVKTTGTVYEFPTGNWI
ncbi:MAG TPA: hypothetical protein VIK89_09495 [Cytophagaceae bacterium]